MDAAGDDEQREQQEGEGDIVEQQRMENLGCHRAHAECDGAGYEQRDRPECGDLAEMMLPEMRCEQRQERDREQEPSERDRPDGAERRTVEMERGGNRTHRIWNSVVHAPGNRRLPPRTQGRIKKASRIGSAEQLGATLDARLQSRRTLTTMSKVPPCSVRYWRRSIVIAAGLCV